MGVIVRQSIKNAIVTYASVVLGAINVLLIYPLCFSPDQLGIFQFVTNNAVTFFPFVMFGVNALVIRFFPDFKNQENGHNGFLMLLVSLGFSGFLLFCGLAVVFQDLILGYYGQKSELYIDFLPYFIPLVLLAGLEYILATFCANFSRIAVPAFFTNFLLKALTGCLAVCYYYHWIDFNQFMMGVVGAHAVAVLGLLGYLYLLGQLHWRIRWDFLKKPLVKALRTYAFFGILGSLGGMLAVQLDVFMVGTLLDLPTTASFTIAMFMASLLDVPRRSIEGISAPIIAQAWKDGNLLEINKIYKKSSLNQFLAGWFILIGIWSSIEQVFAIMPNGERFEGGKYVVLILGIGRLIDLVTGVNHIMISYSRYFKFNFYVIFVLAFFNILGNFIFIPIFHINGPAIATAFSLGLYNLLKLWFIYYKFKMQPFSINLIWIGLLGVLAYLAGQAIPPTFSPWLDIILKSSLISGIFAFGVLYFKLSPEVSELWMIARKGVAAFLKK